MPLHSASMKSGGPDKYIDVFLLIYRMRKRKTVVVGVFLQSSDDRQEPLFKVVDFCENVIPYLKSSVPKQLTDHITCSSFR